MFHRDLLKSYLLIILPETQTDNSWTRSLTPKAGTLSANMKEDMGKQSHRGAC